jgi:peptidoglycan/LPS O-acetylase OafA/YrhL
MPQKTPIRPTTHWLSIFLLIPFLILCCYFTYTKIEYPFIKLTGRVNSFIRGIIGDRRKP